MNRRLLCTSCSVIFLLLALTAISSADTYNPTTNFVAGWTTGTNPNGVWSYGYSNGMTGPINLYTTYGPGSALTPTALNWGGDAAAPALYYNNGPANNNFNTVVSANQIDICAGWPNDNVYSDLVFTAPTSGSYSAVGSFQGDQYGIDVNVGVLGNGTSLFSSNINSEGTLAPFNTSVSLTAGEQIVFYSTNVGGTQNTGFDVNITSNSVAVPEPSISLLLGMGLAGVGAMRWKFSR